MRMFEKAILLFIFFLPFQFALHPTGGIDLAVIRVLAIGIFLWWGIQSLAERRCLLPRPLQMFCFGAFLLWCTLSFLWAENDLWALRKSAFLWSFFPLFLVFFAHFREQRAREKMFQVWVQSASVIAIISLIQFSSQWIWGVEKVFLLWTQQVLPFFLGPVFGEAVAQYPSLLVNLSGWTVMRASGFFPDPHIAAFFFGMTLPLAIALAWQKMPRYQIYWIVCAGVIFLADLLTFSRGGYIGLLFGLSAFFISIFFQQSWKKHTEKFILGLIFLGIILISPVGTRLFSSFSYTDGSNVERVRLWQGATASIRERPIAGVGLGNYPLFIKPSASYREPIYVHNLFLDSLVEIGLVGFFFFMALLFSSLYAAWSAWRRKKSLFALACFSSLILFLAHAFFETPLFSVHIAPLLILLLAVSSTFEEDTNNPVSI